jgi:hypothetical protein
LKKKLSYFGIFIASFLLACLLHSPLWLNWYLERRFNTVYESKLNKDVVLYADDGTIVGTLKKGAKVFSPSFHDMDSTDLGDPNREKLLIDFDHPPEALQQSQVTDDAQAIHAK